VAEDQSIGMGGQDQEAADQIRRLIKAAREKRFRMVMFAAVFAILGGIVAAFIPDLYEARTKLLLRESKLIDDSVLLKAIQDKTLAQKERTLAQELTSFSWVDDVLKQVEWVEYAEVRNDPALLQELVHDVRDPSKFKVEIETDSSGELLVELIFKWYEPQKAHDYVLRTRKNWVERRIQSTQKYHTHQLTKAEEILADRRAVYMEKASKLQEFQTEHDLSAIDETNVDSELRISLVLKKSETQAKLKELETRIRTLQEQRAETDKIKKVENKVKNPDYELAESALKSAQLSLKKMALHYTDKNPNMVKQRERVEALQVEFDALEGQEFDVNTVVEEINPTWQALSDDLNRAIPQLDGIKEQMTDYLAQLEVVSARMAEYPVLIRDLHRLQNERDVAMEDLNSVMKQISPLKDKHDMLVRSSTKLFSDSEDELEAAGAYEVLEEPFVPKHPVGLPKAIYPLIGLVLGALLSLGLSLLTEVTRSTYENPKEVHRALQLPVLGGTANISTARERRRLKARQVAQMAGGVLIVVTLGVLVYVMTARAELLPLGVQTTLEDLRSQFK